MTSSFIYPRIVEIERIEKYSPDIWEFFFVEESIANAAKPGQFAMLWIPGTDEIPLGFARIEKKASIIGFIVQRVGEGTQKLFQMKIGERVGIRGPFGNGFDLDLWKNKKVHIIGGGVGIAPLMPLTANNSSPLSLDIYYGAKDETALAISEVIDRHKPNGSHLHLATENGTLGMRGTVIDLVEKQLVSSQGSLLFLAAGPERMLFSLHSFLLQNFPSEEWEFSLCDRYMKCGFGICGSCSLDDLGIRLCVEGPVLGRTKLSKLSSFGKFGRDASGRKKYFA
ncbi:MAG: dihydroorotate dehydrogenase electron transfer subunit [Candidatus Thorarchaeota archaeon]